MDSLDLFYKAFTKYRELTVADAEATRFMKVSSGQSSETHEGMKVIFTSCTIDEDWVNAIETGLPFIEKAIKEERKFIRSEGDVLPIEKVRKTTVTSIQDLAKHSNYITHEGMSDGPTDIMPDKLLVVTKENDYAVYENKVVYACLLYLKDFVSSRLTKIKNETNKYEGRTFVDKKLDVGNRKVEFNFTLHEKRLNDPFVSKLNSAGDIIARLDKIIALILAFLKTPLMNEVAKADLVSRPITKTNVLRMDRNFRETLSLFDYIAGYQGDGFTLTTTERNLYPFSMELANDTCQIILLASFLNYMYGNSLTTELRERFTALEEEEKRREEEKLLTRLSSIHSKANMAGKTINDYLIAFEEGYRILEDRLEQREEDIKKLELDHKKELHDLELVHENEIREIENTHQEEIAGLENQYKEEMNKVVENCKTEIANAEASCLDKIEAYKVSKDEEIAQLKEKYETELGSIREVYETQIKEMSESFEKEKTELTKSLKDKTLEAKEFEKKYHAGRGSVTAMKLSSGRQEDFPTIESEADFELLEKDFEAFQDFYEFHWQQVKQHIRERIMSEKPETRREKRARLALEAKQAEEDKKSEEVVEKKTTKKKKGDN